MTRRIIFLTAFAAICFLPDLCAETSNHCDAEEALLLQFKSDREKVREKLPLFWSSMGKEHFASDLFDMFSAALLSFGKEHSEEKIICFFIRGASMSCPKPKAFLLTEKYLYAFFFNDAFSPSRYGLKKLHPAGNRSPYADEYLEIVRRYSKEPGGWDNWIGTDVPLAYFVFRTAENDNFYGFFYEYHGLEKDRFLPLNLFVEKIFRNSGDQ